MGVNIRLLTRSDLVEVARVLLCYICIVSIRTVLRERDVNCRVFRTGRNLARKKEYLFEMPSSHKATTR